jgi:hypothetical protein
VRNGILNQSYRFEDGLKFGDTIYFVGQFLQHGEMIFTIIGHGSEAFRLTFSWLEYIEYFVMYLVFLLSF